MADPRTLHSLSGYIYDINSTPLNGATVKITNTRTGDILSTTTNSQGEYVFELAELTNGYTDSEKILIQSWKKGTIFKSESIMVTISGNSTEQDLTLKPSLERNLKVKDIKDIQNEEYSDLSNAKRSLLVDETGEVIDTNNPLNVNIKDISKGTQTNDVKVTLDSEKVQITDGTNDLYIWKSGGRTSVRAVHWRIKESKEWYSSYKWSSVANTNSVYLQIKTDSTKSCHGNISVEADGKCTIEIYENPTLNNDGTELTENSMNRETITSPATNIYRDPNVSSDGTLLEIGLLGVAGKFIAAGGVVTDAYWLFKPNEDYLVKVTNNSGGNLDIVIHAQWHEHMAV